MITYSFVTIITIDVRSLPVSLRREKKIRKTIAPRLRLVHCL